MATSAVEIPLQAGRSQRLKVALVGIDYILRLNWNRYSSVWDLDIYDAISDLPILRGVPLVTGADLLAQYPYLTLAKNGSLFVVTTAVGVPRDDVPTFTNLGIDAHLYYVTR